MINPGPYIFLDYLKSFIFKSSCNLLDVTSFNLLFVCFSYFIQNVFEDYADSCSYCRQWRNSTRNCHWQLLDWLKTQVSLQFKFFLSKMVYNFYVNWIGPLDKASPYINLLKNGR